MSSSVEHMSEDRSEEVGFRGMDQKVVYIDPDKLIPYERNAKIHGSEVEFLMNNIRELGFRNPIRVTKDMVITSGHGRLIAAKRLGMKQVPVIIDEDFTEDEAKAYRLNDNQMSDMAGYDFELRDLELEELEDAGWDMENFGFLLDDFDADDVSDEPDITDLPERKTRARFDDDQDQEYPEEDWIPEEAPRDLNPSFKDGDLVVMGRHMLLHGQKVPSEPLPEYLGGVSVDTAFVYLDGTMPYNEIHGAYKAASNATEDVILVIPLGDSAFSGICTLMVSEKLSFSDIFVYRAIENARNDRDMAFIRASKRNSGPEKGIFTGNWVGRSVLEAFTRPGEVILDLTGPVLSMLVPCEDMDRVWIGNEPSPEVCRAHVNRYIGRIGTADGTYILRKGKKIRIEDA